MIEKGYSEDMAGRNIKLGEDSVQLRQISVAVLETEQTQARAHTWNQKTGHREEGVRGGGVYTENFEMVWPPDRTAPL